jgi:hypothetical protein
MPMGQVDKKLVKDAVKEVFDERAVTYANGAVKFANAITESWSGLINALDGFFLRNFIEDQPEAAKAILAARLSAARRARDLITEKIKDLEGQARSSSPPKSRRRPAKR